MHWRPETPQKKQAQSSRGNQALSLHRLQVWHFVVQILSNYRKHWPQAEPWISQHLWEHPRITATCPRCSTRQSPSVHTGRPSTCWVPAVPHWDLPQKVREHEYGGRQRELPCLQLHLPEQQLCACAAQSRFDVSLDSVGATFNLCIWGWDFQVTGSLGAQQWADWLSHLVETEARGQARGLGVVQGCDFCTGMDLIIWHTARSCPSPFSPAAGEGRSACSSVCSQRQCTCPLTSAALSPWQLSWGTSFLSRCHRTPTTSRITKPPSCPLLACWSVSRQTHLCLPGGSPAQLFL